MIESLKNIAMMLDDNSSGVYVQVGFKPDPAESPLLEKLAFVSSKCIENGVMDGKAAVYFPASLGGRNCAKAAEELKTMLEQDVDTFIFEDVKVGAVRYERSCLAFVCDVDFRAIDCTSVRYSFSAREFQADAQLTVSGRVPRYRIARSFESYLIMTIFKDEPHDVFDRGNVYDITLYKVPAELTELLAGNGAFSLTVEGEEFGFCCCVKSVEENPYFTDLTIRGYKPVYEREDDSEYIHVE